MISQHPLIGELSDLSEEELQQKITELWKKMNFARGTGNAHLVNQVAMALESFQNAYQNKLRKDNPDTPFNLSLIHI